MRGEVAVLNFDVATLDGKLVATLLCDVIPHCAAAETADVLGQSIDHSKAGADDVRGVVHRDHFLPVAWPAIHVLRVACGEVLQFAQLALVVQFLDEKKFAAVDDRLGHHVLEASLVDGFAQFLAFLDGGRHRHGAHHVFSGAQGLERLRGVIGYGGVDVDGIDLRILQQFVVIGVSFLDVKLICDGVHLRLITSADGDEVCIWVRLMNRDEFCAEAKSDDGNVKLFVAHSGFTCVQVV